MTNHERPQRLRYRPASLAMIAVVVAALTSAATWSAFRWWRDDSGPRLPVLGAVPDFALTGSDGQPLSRAQLAGRVWVADFIFTNCPGMCPVLTAQMVRVQEMLAQQEPGANVRLVSFSVDPANDTPAVLRAYADRFGADRERWLFVTGDRDALHALIQKGFQLAVAERSESAAADDGGELITHSDRFVLVDPRLQIRGYYHGMDNDDIDRLLRDLQTLQREG